MGQAVSRYEMIEDGDRILVGVSGGKDSLVMLWLLNERLARIPVHYTLYPVYIDLGFKPDFSDRLKQYLKTAGFDLIVDHTDFGPVAHSKINRENPCFLCARRRRQRLFEIGDELGCRKIALGHNQDDLIETLFLNMCYAGELSTMVPLQKFFKGAITILRPLAHAAENDIRRFADQINLPVFTNPCPSSGKSRRQEIKDLLKTLYRRNRKIKGNIFRAMHHVNLDYLPHPAAPAYAKGRS
ncbi:MAG: tRNA 2-thiocytidine(32) synthetase TtcA [Deltaproteobacteria bacterium]|nr:MAG: tRNA 2-thiocytidine(32) synthetase TtcA [Deltaproteobacteria bacterium]